MPPRYIVRRNHGEQRYSVWDNDKNALAVAQDRECTDLGFEDAFNIADDLNEQGKQPKEK